MPSVFWTTNNINGSICHSTFETELWIPCFWTHPASLKDHLKLQLHHSVELLRTPSGSPTVQWDQTPVGPGGIDPSGTSCNAVAHLQVAPASTHAYTFSIGSSHFRCKHWGVFVSSAVPTKGLIRRTTAMSWFPPRAAACTYLQVRDVGCLLSHMVAVWKKFAGLPVYWWGSCGVHISPT